MPPYISEESQRLIKRILNKEVSKRPRVGQIAVSTFMKSVILPKALKSFAINPEDVVTKKESVEGDGGGGGAISDVEEHGSDSDVDPDFGKDEERMARRILNELGITEEVIMKARGKNSRSAITGAYRIVLHRLQKQALGIYFADIEKASS